MAKKESKIEKKTLTDKKEYDHGDVVLRFSEVSFGYGHNKPILDAVDFVVRERAKLTLMGQNGAGKSTIFNLILGTLPPDEGSLSIKKGATIGHAMQAVPREKLEFTVKAFFESAFSKKVYDIDPRIEEVFEAVNLQIDPGLKVSQLSGGQQARLLLAYALIQKPDILLLDEPTNNLDVEGIEHLTKFLIGYPKTCIVISHDAHFLNAFTHGVLYLDSFTKKVEQYVGDYLAVVQEIAARIDRERKKNASLLRDISNRKEQMNFFAQKGGHMRDVARKMREAIEELEAQIVDMRQEDKTINTFAIPAQTFSEPVLKIEHVEAFKNFKVVSKKVNMVLKKGSRLLISGPNGIGKSTLIDAIARKKLKGATYVDGLKLAYYKQDFGGLDFDKTVYKALAEAMGQGTEEAMRSTAAQFLLTADTMQTKVGALSEGQKGLLYFAMFCLQKPGLLILDEPTNHINFRHLPVIAQALNKYEGALVVVSHMREFVEQINFNETIDLGAI